MATERIEARDLITTTLQAAATLQEQTTAADRFTITCYGADGQLKWQEETHDVQRREIPAPRESH